jgi:hypothetical protein
MFYTDYQLYICLDGIRNLSYNSSVLFIFFTTFDDRIKFFICMPSWVIICSLNRYFR